SSDDSEPSNQNIVGTWICYEQTWLEDGETDTATYSDNSKYIIFYDDFTGELRSDGYGLMEISTHGSSKQFTWKLADNKIISNFHGEEVWNVISISDTSLTLQWVDDDLTITCKFKKLQVVADNGPLTAESLVGRWACLTYSDYSDNGAIRNLKVSDKDISEGNYPVYIDFYENGSGYKKVGSLLVLGSTSTTFNWEYDDGDIIISIGTHVETWSVLSYKDGVLTLSGKGETATFKKGGH
ncbi:MAG: hypothetical protein IK075_09725, partial [Prevotella sp.]|nr:hypothetical protein [Prevotella sp.]